MFVRSHYNLSPHGYENTIWRHFLVQGAIFQRQCTFILALKTFKANFYSSQKHINLVKSVCGAAIVLHKDSQLNWNATKSMPYNGFIIQLNSNAYIPSQCSTMDSLSNWTDLMQCSFIKLKATCNLNCTQGYFNGKVFKIVNKTSGLGVSLN